MAGGTRWAERALVAVLGLAAAGALAYGLLILFFGWEWFVGESLNAHFTERLVEDGQLYVDWAPGHLVFPIYPPGVYLAQAPFEAVFGYELWPGRLISIASFAFAAFAGFRIARRLGCSPAEATVSALGAFTFTVVAAGLVVANRPDALAVGLAGAALLAATRWEEDARAGRAVARRRGLRRPDRDQAELRRDPGRDRRGGLAPRPPGGDDLRGRGCRRVPACGSESPSWRRAGPSCATCATSPTPATRAPRSGTSSRGRFCRTRTRCWSSARWRRRFALSRPRSARAVHWAWLGSLAVVLSAAKLGSAANYWLLTIYASAVLAGPALQRLRRHAGAAATGVAALLLALTLLPQTLKTLEDTNAIRDDLSALEDVNEEAAERMAAGGGEVFGDRSDLALAAGGPPSFDAAPFVLLERSGEWDPGPVAEAVRARRFATIQSSFDLAADPVPSYQGVPAWPLSVIEAARASYCEAWSTEVSSATAPGIWLYRPCPAGRSAPSGEAAR